jgi:hypothetical protein
MSRALTESPASAVQLPKRARVRRVSGCSGPSTRSDSGSSAAYRPLVRRSAVGAYLRPNAPKP